MTYRAGRPTSDLHHEDAPREDGYFSACWRRTLGRAGPWTQHNVYSNRPSVRRHLRKGWQRASRRQAAASSLDSRRGDHRYSHDLAAGVGGPRQGAAGGTGALRHRRGATRHRRVRWSSLFSRLGNGQLSHDDRCFFPTNEALGPVADRLGLLHCAKRMVTRGCKGEEDTTLLLVEGTVAAAVCRGACACNGRRRRAGTQAGWNPSRTSFLCRETRRAAPSFRRRE